VVTVANAHGQGAWISALAAFPFSDLAASGSSDGMIRLWRVSEEKKSVVQIGQIAQVRERRPPAHHH
jgi:WD40 repeat protein